MRNSLGAALVLTMCATTALVAGPLQGDGTPRRGRLNPRIAPADRQRYQSIHDASTWLNPYLVVRADGVEVIAKGIASGRRIVAPADVRQTLIELPVNAWPYGRVVALVSTGLRAVDRSGLLDRNDEDALGRNRRAVVTILKALGVVIERWPSA